MAKSISTFPTSKYGFIQSVVPVWTELFVRQYKAVWRKVKNKKPNQTKNKQASNQYETETETEPRLTLFENATHPCYDEQKLTYLSLSTNRTAINTMKVIYRGE